ncbi:MAG: FAD-binding protein [Nocardia sp.]|nr:FAD-binding protein [Nocardia sp.]
MSGDAGADVLVIGGGPSGAWSALAAARAGARVILVDKQYCGGSGPSAKGPVALWDIPAGPGREEAVLRSQARGGGLADPEWLDRVAGETHRRIPHLLPWGHRQPAAAGESSTRVWLHGRRYLTALRAALVRAGVRIFDHHPALYLLRDTDGVVSGAGGVQTRNGFRTWSVRAGAVVLASGGCAFLSGVSGTDVNTGEGLLMAVEAGGELSGMEFSGAYRLATVSGRRDVPAHGLVDAAGSGFGDDEDRAGSAALAALAEGQPVYAQAGSMDIGGETMVVARERQRVRPVLEGTVRGSGGLNLTGFDCATTVPGLHAAGDAASREATTGAVGSADGPGGGWAIASGLWAGAGAARFARGRGGIGRTRPVSGAGLNPRSGIDPRAVVGLVQEHTLPLRRSYYRCAGSLRDSIAELDAIWPVTGCDLGGVGADLVRARQAAALLVVARWTKYSALARTETRGLHRRTDHPGTAQDWCRRLQTGGVGQIWVRAV